MRWWIATAVMFLATAALAADAPLFPFVLPWDDAAPGVTDLSGWSPGPAGKLGPVRAGDDGHFSIGDKRIRFLGVNLSFGACFPSQDDAAKVAGRLAKFGVNVVRFHHMDMNAYPGGIRSRQGDGTGELDSEALNRLDHFIAELKKRGVYTNLNLLVSRPFNKADGLPAEIERVGWKERAAVGFFHEPARKLQMDYAAKLLRHKNTVTGLTYAEDPAVAFVEVHNENGLIHAWLGGEVDALPEVFKKDLQRQWVAWLKRRHGITEKLRQVWGVKDEKPGAELLTNADFARGLDGWTLERHDQAEAKAAVDEAVPDGLKGAKSVKLSVTREGKEGWHVQFNQSGLKVVAEKPYTLTFWAKADKPATLTAEVGQAHPPWNNLGLRREVKLTTEWQQVRFVFFPAESDDNARVNFGNLGRQLATVWLAAPLFKPGGVLGLADNERLEDGTLPLFERARFGERTAEAQRDWLRFLWEIEDDYWQAMKRHLKDNLGVKGVVLGTIVGCSTPNLMAKFDAVDTHAYWQHPHFPNKPWDSEDWVVGNKSMVNEPGGVLPGLALRRVLGKPHVVSEYNHAAPNTFGSEGFLLLAAYGALQDWDAIYAYSYSHNTEWDTRKIPSFFDVNQHPTKMATLPAAAAMFLRGDVRSAREQVLAAMTVDREIDLLRTARAWDLVHAGTLGVPREAALIHRVALHTDGMRPLKDEQRPIKADLISDTGELKWDLSDKGRGVVTVNAAKSKAVIGYGGGKTFDLGGVVIEPGPTSQDGWGTVTVTALEGSLQGPGRLLITASGTAENTGMKWKSAAKESVGRDWGQAPSLVEGVPAKITLPVSAEKVKAWTLDERGQRRDELPVANAGGKAAVSIGPERKTLWYEVELK